MKNNTFQMRVTDEFKKALEERAKLFGVTPSDYVRSLILEDLKKEFIKKEG